MKKIIDHESWQPVKIQTQKFSLFAKRHRGLTIVDQYERNLEELFLLRNPKHRFNKNYTEPLASFRGKYQKMKVWFYFPWLHTAVSFLPEAMHQKLRTGRNQYLITEAEQKKYYDAVMGVLGMSVGSHVALTIAMTGGARHIKIADPDTISGDNLNRIRSGFQNVGTKKAIVVARQIYEMNPYAEVELFDEGLTEENMADFLKGLDVLVEEMDNPYLKVKVRFEARKRGIPVVMAADNGDGIIADIERFDVKKTYPILHGILGRMTPEDFKNISPQKLPGVMAKIAGADRAHLRMLESVLEVGKTIYSWPQLGTAATMCGSVLAYLARRVALRDSKIKSGRYEVNPDVVFEHEYHAEHQVTARTKRRGEILKQMGIE